MGLFSWWKELTKDLQSNREQSLEEHEKKISSALSQADRVAKEYREMEEALKR
jgi:hypothetical protein